MVLVGALIAAGSMEWALLSHDFSIAYVYKHLSRSTPLLYTVAALWGALEGSILLWALVLSGYLVTYGGLLLLGGRAGDLLGRRRRPVAGTAVFAACSLAGGLAGGAGMLIGADDIHPGRDRIPARELTD